MRVSDATVRFFTLSPTLYVCSPYDQPAKLYPVFVNPFAGRIASLSYVNVDGLVEPPVAPFPSYSTVNVIAVKRAYTVALLVPSLTGAATRFVEPFVTSTPPVISVKYPLKIYPFAVGVASSVSLIG